MVIEAYTPRSVSIAVTLDVATMKKASRSLGKIFNMLAERSHTTV